MSILDELFGKRKENQVPAQQIHATVKRLYDGMNPERRDKIFYGGIENAQNILLTLSKKAFHSAEDDKINLSLQIYVQAWIRSRGGFGLEFITPSYIKETLAQRFSAFPRQEVLACIELSLLIIYQHEPKLREAALAAEAIIKNVKEKAAQNLEIQDQHLKDEDYGLVPNKPIFVVGFGSDREYLSHLFTTDGTKLSFEREGSSEVNGICGPVDLYKLLLPDGTIYMRIYVCNYGTRNTVDVPRGILYQ